MSCVLAYFKNSCKNTVRKILVFVLFQFFCDSFVNGWLPMSFLLLQLEFGLQRTMKLVFEAKAYYLPTKMLSTQV